ncbi:MAG TPA: hypothetical protein VFB60_19245 [Ktedonobacteraceae bacterium]|nr:hypothetical protein [Ktedonobacteraceae bacterium]
MSKSLTRILYLIAVVIGIVAGILEYMAFAGVHVDTTTGAVTGGNPGLLSIALAIAGLAGILAFVSWIGALVKTAQLARWGWFIVLLLLSWLAIPMLVYIFAGPETPARQPQLG